MDSVSVRVDELVKDRRPPEAAALRAVLDKFINTNNWHPCDQGRTPISFKSISRHRIASPHRCATLNQPRWGATMGIRKAGIVLGLLAAAGLPLLAVPSAAKTAEKTAAKKPAVATKPASDDP